MFLFSIKLRRTRRMDNNSPNSLITQVSKDQAKGGNTKLLSAQDDTHTGQIQVSIPDNSTTSNQEDSKSRFNLLNLLCCCPSRPSERSGAPYRKDTLVGGNFIELSTDDMSQDLQENFLLPPQTGDITGKKTLVLDLDETLVHSSFKPIANPDFVIPVEIEDQIHKVYVVKRPHVDVFMQKLGKIYEVVVFTASLAKYADPVLDLLDIHKVVRSRLFREACSNYKGNYVKDLSRLGRELKNTIIIDNSPPSYLFHPENAVPIESWFDDENDTELLDMIPFLESLTKVDNVRTAIEQAKVKNGKFIV